MHVLKSFTNEPWQQRAACRGLDLHLFYPISGGRSAAQIICQGCVVREDCLADALQSDEKFGIWGGATELDRVRVRAAERARRAATSGQAAGSACLTSRQN